MGIKIKASDLKYTYSKTATNGDNPKFSGKPDNLLFNRHEEYEVIPMFEKVMDELATTEQVDLYRLEDMVKQTLPSTTRSRAHVFDWLLSHF